MNCETDFVARNEQFRLLVSQVADTIITCSHSSSDSLQIEKFDSVFIKDLTTPTTEQSLTISDLIAQKIGYFSENISVARGCVMMGGRGQIIPFTYNQIVDQVTGVAMGTYAALVQLQASDGARENNIREVGRLLGQHIVGLEPKSISSTLSAEGCGFVDGRGSSEESALLNQLYLMDNSVTVGEWLDRQGIQVTAFIRYGLGETAH